MALPILYSFRRCPYAMRARLALQIGGQRVELREVRLREKPAELLAASPRGTVPVLIDTDGKVISESLDIMLWSLRRNDPEAWLGSTSAIADEMFELIARCDGEFKLALDHYKHPRRFADADPLNARDRAAAFLLSLDRRLERCSCLFGSRASMADFAILPFVRQFAMIDREWFEAQSWSALRKWLAGFVGSSLFERIMIRLEPWSSASAGLDFPVAGSFD